jgi:hypothetical protein
MRRTFGVGALTMISACVSGGADPTMDASVEDARPFAPPPLPQPDASSPSSDASILLPPKDAGTDASGGTCPTPLTVTPATFDQDPGWKPAKAPAPVCTTIELSQFEKNLDDANIKTWTGLATGLGTTCAACIVTSDAEANYGPVVYFAASGGTKGYYNFGACFGQVETQACGKAVQYLEYCLDRACDACTTQGQRDSCINDAADTNGTCSAFVTTLANECKTLSTSGKKCNNMVDAAKTLCGPNAGDAGTDGGDGG